MSSFLTFLFLLFNFILFRLLTFLFFLFPTLDKLWSGFQENNVNICETNFFLVITFESFLEREFDLEKYSKCVSSFFTKFLDELPCAALVHGVNISLADLHSLLQEHHIYACLPSSEGRIHNHEINWSRYRLPEFEILGIN